MSKEKRALQFLFIMICCLILVLAGCSASREQAKFESSRPQSDAGAAVSYDHAASEQADSSANYGQANVGIANSSSNSNSNSNSNNQIYTKDSGSTGEELNKSTSQRMVIYTASLHIKVEKFSTAQAEIEQLVSQLAGYVVQARDYQYGDEGSQSGELTVRIPQSHFHQFLNEIGKISVKVTNRSVNGTDVTEEYVDLASRLKSKEVVEERLLAFMKEAKETADLLRISEDLERVQQEIEQLKGKMNYLQNQSALATVTIYLEENQVKTATIKTEDLNTWEKTKKFFVQSINSLITVASYLFIFLFGFSPILILLFIVGVVVYVIMKRKKKNLNV